MQSFIRIFLDGTLSLIPSNPDPDFIAIPSSPTSTEDESTETLLDDSISIPSVFGASYGLIMLTSFIVTLSEKSG